MAHLVEVFALAALRMSSEELGQLVPLAYQTVTGLNFTDVYATPKITLMKSRIHTTTLQNGEEVEDNGGPHIVGSYKDDGDIRNKTHRSLLGYTPGMLDYTLRFARGNVRKPDSVVLKKQGRPAWPSDNRETEEVAYDHSQLLARSTILDTLPMYITSGSAAPVISSYSSQSYQEIATTPGSSYQTNAYQNNDQIGPSEGSSYRALDPPAAVASGFASPLLPPKESPIRVKVARACHKSRDDTYDFIDDEGKLISTTKRDWKKTTFEVDGVVCPGWAYAGKNTGKVFYTLEKLALMSR